MLGRALRIALPALALLAATGTLAAATGTGSEQTEVVFVDMVWVDDAAGVPQMHWRSIERLPQGDTRVTLTDPDTREVVSQVLWSRADVSGFLDVLESGTEQPWVVPACESMSHREVAVLAGSSPRSGVYVRLADDAAPLRGLSPRAD